MRWRWSEKRDKWDSRRGAAVRRDLLRDPCNATRATRLPRPFVPRDTHLLLRAARRPPPAVVVGASRPLRCSYRARRRCGARGLLRPPYSVCSSKRRVCTAHNELRPTCGRPYLTVAVSPICLNLRRQAPGACVALAYLRPAAPAAGPYYSALGTVPVGQWIFTPRPPDAHRLFEQTPAVACSRSLFCHTCAEFTVVTVCRVACTPTQRVCACMSDGSSPCGSVFAFPSVSLVLLPFVPAPFAGPHATHKRRIKPTAARRDCSSYKRLGARA